MRPSVSRLPILNVGAEHAQDGQETQPGQKGTRTSLRRQNALLRNCSGHIDLRYWSNGRECIRWACPGPSKRNRTALLTAPVNGETRKKHTVFRVKGVRGVFVRCRERGR